MTPASRGFLGVLAGGLTLVVALLGLGGEQGAVRAGGYGTAGVPGSIQAVDPASVGSTERGAFSELETAEAPYTHEVAPGETPSQIAERHGVSTASLLRANAAVRADRLRPGDRLVVPDPDAPRPPTPQEAMTADLEIEAVLEEAAAAFGWNPATVKAVAWVESRWNHRLVSHRGAIGVMQVQPATGAVVERRLGRQLDLHDPVDNAYAGVAYLDLLYQQRAGDVRAVLAAYNQGPAALRRHGVYPDAGRYVEDVLRMREVFRAP